VPPRPRSAMHLAVPILRTATATAATTNRVGVDLHNQSVTRDQPGPIEPGDIYEDCSFHPLLCTHVGSDGDHLSGISLIDASGPRGCSLRHCGVIKLSIADVVAARSDWPGYLAGRKAEFEAEQDVVAADDRAPR